jgi:non-lysosomal glucosylceramidase
MVSWRPAAGPFTAADFERLVPSDKRLSQEWIRSLTERGQPQTWRGAELAHVGLPVGGIGCGQLYLGGDGRLWHWRIFKPAYTTDYSRVTTGPHYAKPLPATSPIDQGFAARITVDGQTEVRELSARGFAEIAFRGEYPMGKVQYSDPSCAVTFELEAFSPFIPLDADSSGLPATIMQFTIKNPGRKKVEVELAGWMQNAVCLDDDQPTLGIRRNRIAKKERFLLLECTAEPPSTKGRPEKRPEILFEDFEREAYDRWTATGTAFGEGPTEAARMPKYQGEVGASGKRLINTHNARQGEDLSKADAHLGTLTSAPFLIERDFITFLIGGGNHPGKTCLNLLVDGAVVASATGHNENRMHPDAFDVSAWAGKTAQLQIVDEVQGGWGNIGLDRIIFTDEVPAHRRLERLPGFGTMSMALLRPHRGDTGTAAVAAPFGAEAVFNALRDKKPAQSVTTPFGQKLVGALLRKVTVKPGDSSSVHFVVTWYFPSYANPVGEMAAIKDIAKLRRHYAKYLTSASEVAAHIARHFDSLAAQTRLWNQTWYDSTLPFWFLDRTFIPIDTLATTTCHWFDSGRFYGWEGVDCCPGTCQHVWQYAQAMARIFPQLERDLRERVDFGLAWRENGAMDYRAENGRNVAHDGFAGTILRVYREHQMSADSSFLKRVWPRVKKSIEFLIGEDKDENGLLEGEQFNTLDAAWYGPMGWISSLYLAALQAGRQMALEMGDQSFAQRCGRIVEIGGGNLVEQLYNGEYFIHKPDPNHPNATNTNDGCHIDQMFGQSYAWQLGLDRIIPEEISLSALRSLWRYNFTPDIGPYRQNFKAITAGRWYAMPGEGGLLMCTWPKGGAEKAPARGNPTFVGYFNECMTGFEYQVAAHMLWEGMVTEGLAITRTIHDRYHAAKRNPYNEVECSDHYSRAMMSYGVFLAACGYEYHGPKHHLAFAPRITPEDFRAPFTAAEGWGTFTQKRTGGAQSEAIEVKWGKVRLRTLVFALAPENAANRATVTLGGKNLETRLRTDGARAELTLGSDLVLSAGQALEVVIS